MARPPLPLLVLVLVLVLLPLARATGVFKVKRKFGSGPVSLSDLKAHDAARRGRILSGIDLPLGGIGTPTMDGLYYAEVVIGSPAKSYHVQVDTGSDILWLNCFNCKSCPTKTDLGFELKLYNPRDSSASVGVNCKDAFCSSTYGDKIDNCMPGTPCQYSLLYGDGSGSSGFFVNDTLQYNKVSGNMQTVQTNASIVFGCGAQQSGELGSSSAAVDGILGFGQANSSMLSQLASSGHTEKKFAHCFDSLNGGGGIFTIGQVVQPRVKTTPLVSDMPHYNVNLKAIDVGGKFLKLSTAIFDTSEKTGTIIDSGTTLTYLPEAANTALIDEITDAGVTLRESQGFPCFQYTSNVDDGFPAITFHFEGSLTLKVYPHEYLFELQDDFWCIGFQSSTSQSNDREYFLLGDLVLANKLVFYDLENQVIGWTEYNCSSGISVKDVKTGAVYRVGAHNLSSAPKLGTWVAMIFLFLGSLFLFL